MTLNHGTGFLIPNQTNNSFGTQSKLKLANSSFDAGSRINFWTFSQIHISKSELKNGHISRFCSVFQVIQVISSAKFFSAEEVDLSASFHESESMNLRDREKVFSSNVLIRGIRGSSCRRVHQMF